MLFHFHIVFKNHPGGIELRESLISKETKNESLSSQRSNIPTKKQPSELSSEARDLVAQKSAPIEAIKDKICPKTDPNHSETCNVESGEHNTADLKRKGEEGHTKSKSILNSELPQLGAIKTSFLANNSNQTIIPPPDLEEKSILSAKTNLEPELPASNAITNIRNKNDAATETPPAQLVVTFTNNPFEVTNSQLSADHNHCKDHKELERINPLHDNGNNSLDRKNSCDAMYSCCCDDSCFNGFHEKTISSLDLEEVTPSCLNLNDNTMCTKSVSVKSINMDDLNISSNHAKSHTKKRKVAVATQTASLSVSLSSSVGTPCSCEEQSSIKSLPTNDRTLTSVIGERTTNPGSNVSSHTTTSKIKNGQSKYRKTDEQPLSLMQEVPDVSL